MLAAVNAADASSLLETPRPEALLFDLDGVIADVSGSYRRAIIETAESFGVALDAAAVSRAKAAGDANNDWVLTHRLVQQAGGAATLDQVTARFEALYQGTAERPGLWQQEKLLVSADALQRLAACLPLGIVTGRPRADAGRLQRQFGIEELFSALVSMEDAPPKPDPAPVRLLLQRLGVKRAWLVGDTPDDMRAARAADVLPLGVVAPCDSTEEASLSLIDAGAHSVIGALEQLEQLVKPLCVTLADEVV